VAGYVLFDQFRPSEPFVGRAMGLGAGVLLAVVAYALVLETTETATRPSIVGIGMAAGALVFYYGSGWLDRRAASSQAGDGGKGGGLPLAMGAVLDGVPESMVIGIAAALMGEIGRPGEIDAA
jgi:ZIP family zinc transporter